MSDAALAEKLERFIAASCGGGAPKVRALEQVRGGNSSEIWFFETDWAGEQRRCVFRRSAPNEFASPARAAEFALLKALEKTPVPTPRVYAADPDGAWFDRPALIMERCEGGAHRSVLTVADPLSLKRDRQTTLAKQIADVLADIHSIGPDALGDVGWSVDTHPAAQQLALYDEAIRQNAAEPSPELRLAFWWLKDNTPAPPKAQRLVHGDFRPANMLVSGDAITVLDWEFAHLGDPAEDIGWYLTPYYANEHFIPGVWAREDFIARYEAKAGVRLDRAAVRFWAVFALFKLESMRLGSISWFLQGDLSRITTGASPILTALLREITEEAGP